MSNKKSVWKYKYIKPDQTFTEMADEMLKIIREMNTNIRNTIAYIDSKNINKNKLANQ